MVELSPWLIGLVIVIVVAIALLVIFRRRKSVAPEDSYTRGLELWLAGDMDGALTALREAIQQDPDSVDPYHQLGNLLRLAGDAQRAAVVHRGLTVRSDIPQGKRVSIALALAEDLLALERWQETGQLLTSLESHANTTPRFWRLRFEQALGQGDEEAASRALKMGEKRLPTADAQVFARELGFFQLDRSLRMCREDKPAEAKRLLKQIPTAEEYAPQVTLVKALLAIQENDETGAVEIATQGLLDAPEEMELFLPALQDVLLASGQFARSIPILESACQADKSPPTLWISLALLYEKLDERERAISFLANKADDPRLTPDIAAPYLRILAGEQEGTPLGRVWRSLHLPAVANHWRCTSCGAKRDAVRWFCPTCHGFNSYRTAPR